MNILVFNCGSSSLNYKVFRFENTEVSSIVISGKAHRVGVKGTEPSFIEHHLNGQTEKQTRPISNHSEAAKLVIRYLQDHQIDLDAIGHRFCPWRSRFSRICAALKRYLRQVEILPAAGTHP